jgi:hypothetical protein
MDHDEPDDEPAHSDPAASTPAGASVVSYDAARNIVMQLIALSTGTVALTMAFFQDLAPHPRASGEYIIFSGWGLFMISIVCGVTTLLTILGNQADPLKKDYLGKADGVWAANVKNPAMAQILTFAFAVLVTGIGAMASIR